jgi:alpha-amylase
MLQGFHWKSQEIDWYDIIKENAQRIKNSGFTLVWFPPPSDSVAYEGYIPRELNKLDSKYGRARELKEAIEALKPVKAIADIVINHRAGTTGPGDFTNPDWPSHTISNNDEYTGLKSFHFDTGEGVDFARDLDHRNPATKNGIITWMNSLKDSRKAGFVGWRYDLVKGYAGWAIELYNRNTNPEFSVGEFFDYDPQKVIGWIDSTHPNPAFRSTAFDFPLRNALYQAIAWRNFHYLKYADRAAGVIGLWSDKAVTFIENHDTEDVRDNQYASFFPGGDQMVQGYAYILTHPGIPCVFWQDIYDSGSFYEDKIEELIKIRKQYQIHSQSKLYIATAQQGLVYAAYIQGDKGEVAMKIGSGSWQPEGSKWQPGSDLITSGHDYAVWGERGKFW